MNNKNRMKEFYLLSRRDFIKLGLTGALGIAGGLFSRSLPTALAQTLLSGNGPKRLTPIKPFKFAHVTDTHVSTQGTNGAALKKDSIRIFENVLDQLNAINDLDFILFGGDNFDNSEPGTGDFDTFKKRADQLKAPYYIQFGNREASSKPKDDPFSKPEVVSEFQDYGFQGNSFWWSVSPVKGVRVLGLDTSIAGRNDGIIVQPQIDWLKKEIRRYPADLLIILTHHLFLPTWRARKIPPWKKNYVIANALEVRSILEQASNVKLVFSGHHHVAKIQTIKGLPYIASPATVQYPHGFRVISVNNQKAQVDFHQLRDRKIVLKGREAISQSKKYDLFAKGNRALRIAYCLGKGTDRQTTIPLR